MGFCAMSRTEMAVHNMFEDQTTDKMDQLQCRCYKSQRKLELHHQYVTLLHSNASNKHSDSDTNIAKHNTIIDSV